MPKYRVNVLGVQGTNNRVFKANEIVTDENFPEGNAEKLFKEGKLVAIEEAAKVEPIQEAAKVEPEMPKKFEPKKFEKPYKA